MARSLRHLLFSMFGILRVLPFSVRKTLSWHEAFVRTKRKKCGKQPLCAFFKQFGRKEIVGLSRMKDIWFKSVNVISFVAFRRGLRDF